MMLPHFEHVRALFAHLWLGKKRALKLYKKDYVEKFCSYVKGFGAQRCYIAHLKDIHRNIDSMWSRLHFDVVGEHIENAILFDVGDVAEL